MNSFLTIKKLDAYIFRGNILTACKNEHGQ